MEPRIKKEFLEVYDLYKERRSPVATKEDVLLEIIKVYYDSTTKSDKKRSAKLVLESKDRLQEYGFWKHIDEEDLSSRLI
ncbi:hypothetical protein J6TS1_19960 [Siminovitchia terrae]|uniref:Uncharacterized protein n=1 Tax=Siminovitchia terrae TaxID=1914933 RepID=A0ABQ4KVW0_SIMTE|nr:hypothetical protein [Siminovitchia terrae]GIN96126.1 hypothetical protein J6TS1_19960 [Siminovitchia terrae]